MNKLSKILNENLDTKRAASYSLRQFFQKMLADGEIKAYTAEINKKIVEKDDENESIVRTVKGATLTAANELKEYGSEGYIIEFVDSKYNLDIGCRGGMFFDDGDSQTMYHYCTLEKLSNDFDLKKIGSKSSYGEFGSYNDGINFPEEAIISRLRIDYDEDWRNDRIASSRARIAIEGSMDDLFEKVYKFIKEK